MSDPGGPKGIQPGTWEPPPPSTAMSMMSGGFGVAAFFAMLFDACDIGAVLAAIAFLFGLVDVLQIELWYHQVYAYAREPRPETPLAPSQLVAAAATAFDLAAVTAILTDRCDAAMVATILAVLLDLFAVIRRGGSGGGTREVRGETA